jgi:hypothetical protein
MITEHVQTPINEALIIDEPWLAKILSGEKTWELRTTHCHKRGWIGLIRKGSGLVVGIAKILGSSGPLTDQELRATVAQHCVPADVLIQKSTYRFSWELTGARALRQPVPYQHPSGAVKWVILATEVTREIGEQAAGESVQLVSSSVPEPTRFPGGTESSSGRSTTRTARESRSELRARSESTAIVAAAETWLATRFRRTKAPTKYIAGFEIGGGRELALERTNQAIQVWIGAVPAGLPGYRVLNRSNPGQPYAAGQSRNSNLRSATPTLAEGRVAYHIELDDLGTLQALV